MKDFGKAEHKVPNYLKIRGWRKGTWYFYTIKSIRRVEEKCSKGAYFGVIGIEFRVEFRQENPNPRKIRRIQRIQRDSTENPRNWRDICDKSYLGLFLDQNSASHN